MSNPEAEANGDLFFLNYAAAGLFRSNPVLREVIKALTVAQKHSGIEAKVICRNADEVTRALTLLYSRKLMERERAKWNSAEGCLELPNGSAISVWLDGKRAVPK